MTTPETPAAPTTSLGAAAVATPAAPVVEGAAAVKQADVAPVDAANVEADKAALELSSKPFLDVAQLKLSDGLKVDDAAMKEFLPIAKELGLTAKQAQALVEFSAKNGAAGETARAAAQEAAHEVARTKAHEALKADKDIGGANWDKSMSLAGKALAKISSPELNAALEETRLADGTLLGDFLPFAKLLVNLGKQVAEDGTSGSHSAGHIKTAANDAATLHKHMYGAKSPGLKF